MTRLIATPIITARIRVLMAAGMSLALSVDLVLGEGSWAEMLVEVYKGVR